MEISNTSTVNMSVAFNMKNLDSTDLAAKVSNALEPGSAPWCVPKT